MKQYYCRDVWVREQEAVPVRPVVACAILSATLSLVYLSLRLEVETSRGVIRSDWIIRMLLSGTFGTPTSYARQPSRSNSWCHYLQVAFRILIQPFPVSLLLGEYLFRGLPLSLGQLEMLVKVEPGNGPDAACRGGLPNQGSIFSSRSESLIRKNRLLSGWISGAAAGKYNGDTNVDNIFFKKYDNYHSSY